MNNKRNTFIKSICLLLIVLILSSLNIQSVYSDSPMDETCSSWNLAIDFLASPDHENPNRDSCDNLDVWSFMESTNLTHNPTNYSLLPSFTSGLNNWLGTYTDQWGTYPFVGYNATSTPSMVELHPAPAKLTVIAWESPINGYISISGGIYDDDGGCGDGIAWDIELNTTNLVGDFISNGGSQTFSGLSAISVSDGDMLYVIINPNGNISCDTTRIDLVIATTTPPTSTPMPTPTGTPSACTDWNLEIDFRYSPNQENPNRDYCNNSNVWSFMESASFTRNPASYSLLPNFTSNLNNWLGTYTDQWGTYPFIGYNTLSSSQTPIPSSTVIEVHPAPSQMAIVAWKSPISGYVSLLGSLTDSDPSCGDGIQWFVDLNSTNLASGSISNGTSQSFSSGTGGSSLNSIAVNVNDMLYVLVHPNGNISCDTTGIELVIDTTTSSTPTPTSTPTAIPTQTPTITLTSTPITPTPRSNGIGTCWDSAESWPVYSVQYRIDSSIPSSWVNSINNAANIWSNVTPSPFSFVNSSQTPYQISLGNVDEYYVPAFTQKTYIGTTLTDIYTVFNDDRTFDTTNPAPASSFNVQNTMMHEFGHWLSLEHVNATCLPSIMFGGVFTGEANKTLTSADEDAINWQYP
jgi:hypothetical protein